MVHVSARCPPALAFGGYSALCSGDLCLAFSLSFGALVLPPPYGKGRGAAQYASDASD